MDAHLGRRMVVRAEADAAAAFAGNLLPPTHRQRRNFVEVGAMHLGRERVEMMVRLNREREHARHRLSILKADAAWRKRSVAPPTRRRMTAADDAGGAPAPHYGRGGATLLRPARFAPPPPGFGSGRG